MFYKVSVYSRPEDRGLLVWRWKKQFLGEWVESRQEFEDCDHCVHHALQDAKGQSVHLETDRCTLYRYRFESMLHQYGSCYCLSGGRSAEAVLDLIQQGHCHLSCHKTFFLLSRSRLSSTKAAHPCLPRATCPRAH